MSLSVKMKKLNGKCYFDYILDKKSKMVFASLSNSRHQEHTTYLSVESASGLLKDIQVSEAKQRRKRISLYVQFRKITVGSGFVWCAFFIGTDNRVKDAKGMCVGTQSKLADLRFIILNNPMETGVVLGG